MLILGIETSCDETAASVVREGREILSNNVLSQVDTHKKFGGIVPELASRAHMQTLCPLIKKSLKDASISFKELGAIAVTSEPGLISSLLVGTATAKALGFSLSLPLIEVNHLEAHIYANFLGRECPALPAVGLVASGGHSSLFHITQMSKMKLLGKTRDDAAGEAFDKVARILGLGYPGGAIIDELAESSSGCDKVKFPRSLLEPGSLDFSFSGLKTAVLYYTQRVEKKEEVAEIAYSFEKAVVDTLVKKTLLAAELMKVETVLLGGGVVRNRLLRREMSDKCKDVGLRVYYPAPELCTDNAAMVAGLGYHKWKQ